MDADVIDRSQDQAAHSPRLARAGFLTLALGCIGVVYGDIGTSPLYAFRESMVAASGGVAGVDPANVLGVLSLILWALTIIVTLKYVLVLLRADNQGEGGTLTLLALAQQALGRSAPAVALLGAIGAALFFGDALITPAISVLSAVEGLKLVTSAFDPYVLPITVAIILGLFFIQSRGTATVARWFGPITLMWFLVLAWGGARHISGNLFVLEAVNPLHAIRFLAGNGKIGLVTLGAVFLAVTGAEALYADLGHFGRRPIQYAWLFVAFPALGLNYLGQGALLLGAPETIENPFFLLYPDWALPSVVILATLATIIASQAVITGAYSLTAQAIRLRLLPRMRSLHTSAEHAGQIYMPAVNTLLLIGVLALVLIFASSSRLASAYGIAVTGTMVVTALLAMIVVHLHWRWPLAAAGGLILPFLMIDVVFLGANLMKLFEGGFVPLIIAGVMLILMRAWMRGTNALEDKARQSDTPLRVVLESLEKSPPTLVPGTGVYLTTQPQLAPVALLHMLKHFKALHAQNVILTIVTADVPRVPDEERIEMFQINGLFRQVTMRFGYMEEPNVPRGLGLCRKLGWKFDIMSTSFLLSRRSLKPAAKSALPGWQRSLFVFLSRNATNASDYFHIPAGRVVEIGAQVNL
jgi:KUP system potassium uptake protein